MRALTIAVVIGASFSARAQPAPAQTAQDHYEASRRYYDVNEYDKAVAELKIAYTMSADPAYLFNIAQALRKKGDCIGAIDYYQKYLRDSPSATNRSKVEAWITELDSCAKAHKPEPKPVSPISPKPIVAQPITPIEARPVQPVSHHGNRTLRIAGLATAGVGVGVVALGAALGISARNIANDVETECTGPTGCDWALRGKDDDRGRSRSRLSTISFTFGGLAVAGGAVMYVLGRAGHESPVAVAPVSGGAVVSFARSY